MYVDKKYCTGNKKRKVRTMADGEEEPQIEGTDTNQVLQNAIAERQKIEDEQKKAEDDKRIEAWYGIKPGEIATDEQLFAMQEHQRILEQQEINATQRSAAEKDDLGNTYIEGESPLSQEQEEQAKYLEELKTLFDENSDKEHHNAVWELFDEFIDKHNISRETERGLRDYLRNYIKDGPTPEEAVISEPETTNIGPDSDIPMPHMTPDPEAGGVNESVPIAETSPPETDSPEKFKEAEDLLKERLANANTINDIKDAVKAFDKPVVGSVETYDYDRICWLIDEVQNGNESIYVITGMYGLRSAVARVMGLSPEQPPKPEPVAEPSDTSELPPQPSHDGESEHTAEGEVWEEVSGDVVENNDESAPTESSESEDQTTEMPAVGEESSNESTETNDEEKKGWLKNAWEKIKVAPVALQIRISEYINDPTLTPEQRKARINAAWVAGGVATTVALFMLKGNAGDVANATHAMNTGMPGPSGLSSHAGEAMASGHVAGGVDSAETAGRAGEVIHEQLKQGDTIWGHVREALIKHDGKEPSNWKIFKETARTLRENHLTWSSARHLLEGFRYDIRLK